MPFPTSQKDLEYIFDICKKSNYVSGNKDYTKKSKQTKIVFDPSDTVNAYAQTLGANSHQITMLNGLCNITIPLAFAIAQFKINDDIDELTSSCSTITDLVSSSFEDDKVDAMMEKLGYDINNQYLLSEAKSYFTGMLLAVVAHELGHICSSHTVREDGTYETSRNDERTADLFAQSIISTTPFSGYLILSSLFMEILFTWMSKDSDGPATTHPYSRERVMNTVNSHEQYLAEIGITIETIEDFLP